MIESKTSKMNESLLNVLSLNNKIIANNIANVDTPHYKAESLEFQEELRKQIDSGSGGALDLKRTHSKHISLRSDVGTIPYKVNKMSDTMMNNNLNNVDIDAEMSNLAKNQLTYNVIVDRVSGHYSKMKKLFSDLK